MSTWAVLAIISSISTQQGIPEGLLESICYKESKYDVRAINYFDGKDHSYGLCQIKLETARMFGFKGSAKELLHPRTNVLYAGRYLSYQHKRYGRWDKAIIAYNSGSTRRNRNRYYYEVINIWMNKEYLK